MTATAKAASEILRDTTYPHDLDCEMAVLGAMILNNGVIAEVVDKVKADAFYDPRHQHIFQAISELYAGMKTVDDKTLKAQLDRQGVLERVGGTAYLAEVVESVPNSAAATEYAETVYQKARLRTLLQTCERIMHEVRQPGIEPDRLVDRAQQLIYDASKDRSKEEVSKLKDILAATFDQIQDFRDRKQRLQGFASGFMELDDMISGLQASQLYIIAGRPSMGKTSFAMRIIEHLGLEQQKPVLFFSLEMAKMQIAQQMVCAHCKISSHKLRSGMLGEEDFHKLLMGAGVFGEAPIYIDDSADLSDLEIRARARRYQAQFGIQCVVVDYLQKMHSKGAESRQQEISRISSALKSLAKELGVPVVSLAQLNRSPEGRESRRPELADLRESGAIEQDADVVMLLYREDYYNPDTEKKNIAEVIVAKNRTGPTGTVETVFLRDYARFENLNQRPM